MRPTLSMVNRPITRGSTQKQRQLQQQLAKKSLLTGKLFEPSKCRASEVPRRQGPIRDSVWSESAFPCLIHLSSS